MIYLFHYNPGLHREGDFYLQLINAYLYVHLNNCCIDVRFITGIKFWSILLIPRVTNKIHVRNIDFLMQRHYQFNINTQILSGIRCCRPVMAKSLWRTLSYGYISCYLTWLRPITSMHMNLILFMTFYWQTLASPPNVCWRPVTSTRIYARSARVVRTTLIGRDRPGPRPHPVPDPARQLRARIISSLKPLVWIKETGQCECYSD